MRKIFVLLLAVVLTACGAPAATATREAAPAPVEPSATPVVIVQTVVVSVVPTQIPTEVPSATPLPQPTAVPPTAVPPTQPPAPTAGANTSSGPIALDNVLGAGVFINMSMSGNSFTLRCFPRDITFNITANNPDIVDALLYYRIVDTKRLYPSEWKNYGKMVSNGSGNFTLTFTGENVDPNLRLDKGWFDFQFVGLNKGGGVIDRTQKIEQLVTYSIDCP